MITSGFYNSLAGDRKYNSVQISRLFEGIINDGVFASIGESLMVVTSSGMTVNVGTGRAWFNNTWTDNDADIPLTLDAAEAILNRIDAIVLEVGSASDVRANTIKIVKGTPGSVPVAPTMIQTTGKYQYPLATIYVGAGVTSIVAGNITSKINTTECPFVKVVGIEALTPIWENEFNTWFAALQAQMAGDVATNLQNQINVNKNTEIANKTKYATCTTAAATAAKVATQNEFSLVTGVVVGVKFTYANTATSPTLNVNNTGAKAIYLNGSAVAAEQITANMVALFQYDGTYWQLLNPAQLAIKSLLSIATADVYGVSGASANADYILARMPFTSSFVTFAGNVNPNMLDAALGKNVEEYVNYIGLQLAMYAWFKGDSKTTYPFTNLKTCKTLAEILGNASARNEIYANTNLLTMLINSPYYVVNIVNSAQCLKEICSSASLSGTFKTVLQAQRETIISTLNASGLFTKTSNVTYRTLNASNNLCSANLNSNTIIIPTSSPDQREDGAYSDTSSRYLYYGTDSAYQIWRNDGVPIDEVRTVTTGVSLRGIYYKQNKVVYDLDPAVICDVYTVI